MVARIVSAHESDRELRKDLEQEIAVALWRALPRFEGRSTLKTFVARVAEKRCFTHTARHARTPRAMPFPEDLHHDGVDPEAQLESRDAKNRLLAAIRRLPHGHREVVVLSLEGFRHEEIGEVLGLTANNVGVRLHRAKTRLQEMLGGKL